MDNFRKKMRKKLEEMRANLISKIRHDISVPQEERTDIVDFSTFEKMRQVESISSSLDINTLKLIERAIEKIEAGTYGICELCGEPIDRERLEEVPYVRYCVDCQEKLELEEKLSMMESDETEFIPTRVPLDDSEMTLEEVEEEIEEVAEGKPKIVVSPKGKEGETAGAAEDIEEEIGGSTEEEIAEEVVVEGEISEEVEKGITDEIPEEVAEEVEEVLEEEEGTSEDFEWEEEEEEEEKRRKRGRRGKAKKISGKREKTKRGRKKAVLGTSSVSSASKKKKKSATVKKTSGTKVRSKVKSSGARGGKTKKTKKRK